ncbi:MAG TPA: DoxX family protein [Pyrinomonadaceae bacterium]
MTYVLWIIQALLALLFLFAGGTKLVIPPDVLASMGSPNQIPLPGWFVRFIGVAEVLGALGLILPGLLRIKPWLTPLAAAGLVVIMIGATALAMAADGVAAGVVPLAVGLLAVFVAYGRWRLAPHPARREMIRGRSSRERQEQLKGE